MMKYSIYGKRIVKDENNFLFKINGRKQQIKFDKELDKAEVNCPYFNMKIKSLKLYFRI